MNRMSGDNSNNREPLPAFPMTIVLTDGSITKPVIILSGCTLEKLHALAKSKLRKSYKYCLLHEKKVQKLYQICDDHDLQSVLSSTDVVGSSIYFLFTNRLPPTVEDIGQIVKHSSACFVIGNDTIVNGDAVKQLQATARLPGVLAAIGMPDLHVGGLVPIGAAVLCDQCTAYPQLVDSDIGCGMSFVETSMAKGKQLSSWNKLQRVASRLESIDCPYGTIEEVRAMCQEPLDWANNRVEALPELEDDNHLLRLGTVGGSNHFAEFQEFDQIFDAAALLKYGIDADKVHLLVHSGSRSLGAEYLKRFCDQAAASPSEIRKHNGQYLADTESEIFHRYLSNHDIALNYAVRNRSLIAKRLLEQIVPEQPYSCKIDVHHNYLEKISTNQIDTLHQLAQEQGIFPKTVPNDVLPNTQREQLCWIHRKGATPLTKSPILVLPGSRGTFSYLVEINPEIMHLSAYSVAHGAGRKLTRSKAKAMVSARHSVQDLLQTEKGGIVVCEKKDIVFEEVPEAYKDIDAVVGCLAHEVYGERGGLVRVLATLRPLLTYKYKDPQGNSR